MDNPNLILPAHIEDTVRAIAELHADHHRQATPMQRVVDRSVRALSRPKVIGYLTAALLAWIVLNAVLSHFGFASDVFPYPLLQDAGTALGVYITILILIVQRRDDELAQRREQLTLELAILSEQKNAKIIELLEELRRDDPMIRNRVDQDAAALSIPADPQALFEAIVDRHEELMPDASGGEIS